MLQLALLVALLFRVKSRHVGKFRKFRFADVGKSELEIKEKETCEKHMIDRSQNGRSKKVIQGHWVMVRHSIGHIQFPILRR